MRRRPDRRCPKNQENRGGFKVFAERPQMTNKSTTNRLWTGKTPSTLILKTFSWLSTQRGMDGLVKASAGILSCLIAIDAPRPVQRLSWTAAASLQPLFWRLMVNNFLLLPLVCCLSSGMFYRQQLLSFGSRWLAPRIIVWQQMLSIIYRITRTCLWHLFCFIEM